MLDETIVCRNCNAALPQIETDIGIVEPIRDQLLNQIQDVAVPDEKIERVRISSVLTGILEDTDDVEKAIEQLKEYLLKLISSGAKIILE